MKSMTGYGKAKQHLYNIDLDIEIKSVNGKYLDMRVYIPREINFFENIIRKSITSHLTRGTVEVRVNFADHRDPKIQLNQVKLQKYYSIVQEAKRTLNLEDEISLEFLLNEPGIIEGINNLDEDEELKQIMMLTLDNVLSELNYSLQAEAENIKSTLQDSAKQILNTVDIVEVEIQPYKEELFTNMKARTSELLQTHQTENLEQRLLQELAIFIDKYDIHEEISRLRSHVNTLLKTMERSEDCGKSLNFIFQEMQREANTLGSKFSTAKVFPHILFLKEEIEKCREIIQNVA